MARLLVGAIRQGHGHDQAATLDVSEEIGRPRGYVPTWNIALDRCLGTEGLPLGRITEISGWEGCIAGDAEILVNRGGNSQRLCLSEVVRRFNGGVAGNRIWDPAIPTRVQGLGSDGRGRLHTIAKAMCTGVKQVVEIVTSTQRTVRCTPDHEFWTGTVWRAVQDIGVGGQVSVMQDNRLVNLEVLTQREHKRTHSGRDYKNVLWRPTLESIVAIEDAGEVEVFDITVVEEAHSFTANGFVVHNSGKSTAIDQVFAATQVEGGLGALADTERKRERGYMRQIGVQDETLIWIGGQSAEMMFDEVETLIRTSASQRAMAWVEAMVREGVKVPACPVYRHDTWDPATVKQQNRKPEASFRLAKFGREQAAALMEFQIAHGLPPSGIRCKKTEEVLRPVILFTDDPSLRAEAMEAWAAGERHPLSCPADRALVVGWDSVGGTPTEEELKGDARKANVASAAKVIKRNFRRLVQLIDDEAVAFVIANQRYEVIDTSGGPKSRRPKSETYGGGGIKFHATVRVELEKVGKIWRTTEEKKSGLPPLGQITRINVVKNGVGSPDRRTDYGLVYGRGADNAWAVFHDLKDRGIIRQGGAWSKFTDLSILASNKSWNGGWMGLSDLIAAHPELWPRLREIYMEGR